MVAAARTFALMASDKVAQVSMQALSFARASVQEIFSSLNDISDKFDKNTFFDQLN